MQQGTDRKANVGRRGFLRFLAAVGASTAVGGPLLAASARAGTKDVERSPAHQWAMVFDLRKCEGCVTRGQAPQCIEGCNAEHFVPKGQQWITVYEVQGSGGHTYFLPRPCMQCENAPCLNVCPVGATYRTPEGVVLVDHELCIGCRSCMAACPYAARSFNWERPENPPGAIFARYSPEYPVPHRQGTVEKCMLCAHRITDGKLPACADSCPMFAMYLGDLVQDIATNGQDVVQLSRFLADNNAFRLKEDLGTRPRVWYIPGHGQESDHLIDDDRHPQEARTWQELGVSLDKPRGEHK